MLMGGPSSAVAMAVAPVPVSGAVAVAVPGVAVSSASAVAVAIPVAVPPNIIQSMGKWVWDGDIPCPGTVGANASAPVGADADAELLTTSCGDVEVSASDGASFPFLLASLLSEPDAALLWADVNGTSKTGLAMSPSIAGCFPPPCNPK